MANLTQSEINSLIGNLKKYPYLCSAGSDNLGPLSSPPQIESDIETKDVVLYETGTDPQASFIVRNAVKVTIKTRNVDKALTLLSEFKKGDNVLDDTGKVPLTLVPITETTGEKTITFTDAYLQPGLSYAPGQNDEPSEVTLVYICKPDATTGKPFTYSA